MNEDLNKIGEYAKYSFDQVEKVKDNIHIKCFNENNSNMNLNEPQNQQLNIDDVNGSAKLTFGLTTKNLEVIKKHINRWEGAEFDRDTWIRVGEEIGWEPLTACLWYFRKYNH